MVGERHICGKILRIKPGHFWSLCVDIFVGLWSKTYCLAYDGSLEWFYEERTTGNTAKFAGFIRWTYVEDIAEGDRPAGTNILMIFRMKIY